MAASTPCSDTTEAVELYPLQGLWLKPIARLNVSVSLPQLKTPGKSISNWEVMERIKAMVKPDSFSLLKVVKSSLEFIRFEGEVEAKSLLKTMVARLDSKTIKLSGFTEMLKVRAAEAKISFPTRHEWDSYFRDAKFLNETVAGERPDTVHFEGLPCKWYTAAKDSDKPSEHILKKVFATFGEVRRVDIPMLDPYRQENRTGNFNTFSSFSSLGTSLTFEAYVQFKEYIGFVNCMEHLKGMKLMYKGDDGKAATANIKVDFDKSGHLSDKAIRKRRLERTKLQELEHQREEQKRKEQEEEERKKEEERRKKEEEEKERERKREEKLRRREERMKFREEKRREKKLEKKRQEEQRQLQEKIAMEERRILIAQRKLESIRLLTELFKRAKVVKQQQEVERLEQELEHERLRQLAIERRKKEEEELKRKKEEERKQKELQKKEEQLREKLLKGLKKRKYREEEQHREELRQKISGQKLKSAVVMPHT